MSRTLTPEEIETIRSYPTIELDNADSRICEERRMKAREPCPAKRRIPDATTRPIAEMLMAGGKTQQAIAKAAGVSPSLVSQIVNGKRKVPGFDPSRTARKDDRDQDQDREDFPSPSGPFVWCPTCRHKVQMACVACRTKAWVRRRRGGKS